MKGGHGLLSARREGSTRSIRRTTLCVWQWGNASASQSCKLVDVPPFEYLKDVLLRVATHPRCLIAQLTPKAWAEAFGRQAAA